jgi:hypothetical protein
VSGPERNSNAADIYRELCDKAGCDHANAVEPWEHEGSISIGTVKLCDIVPKMLDALRDIHEQAWMQCQMPGVGFPLVPSYVIDFPGHEWWETDNARYAYEILFEALNSECPNGYYFGGHPGDGADVGFWRTEED